jgi:hypothetical protein
MPSDDGGPAFPTKGSAYEIPGMSLRDYFAAHAIVVANEYSSCVETMAACAYEIADAMIAEREGRVSK